MTLFQALTGGPFDRLNWQHSGEFDQNFSKKSNTPGFAREGMGGFGIDRYIKPVKRSCENLFNVEPFFVFPTESVMLGPRSIPESVFYTQSVMLSPRFIPSPCFIPSP